jgi:two-component system, NarL family, response regulator NreC
MSAYRVIVADDHVLFRQGLKSLLQGASDLVVVGEAGDGFELIKLLKMGTLDPDLIVLDISMPNLRGLEAIPEIRTLCPNVEFLIVTMHSDKEYLYQALAAGAAGYLLKKDADAELFAALDKIRKGKTYVSPHLTDELTGYWAHLRERTDRSVLTNREREVLKLIAEGKSNKEIGDVLFISVHTVERHRANIMDKLNLKNTAELVKYAIQKGYI